MLASHDGIAWSPVSVSSNATSLERLNVVAFSTRMRNFVAYGEHDATAEITLPLRYQWFRDGIALSGEAAPTLTRMPLSSADGGSYTVTVSNSAGSVTSSVA